jgi:hypothetical protein
MKKKYEIPEAEELRVSLEMGLLTVTGGQDPFEEEVIQDDSFDD